MPETREPMTISKNDGESTPLGPQNWKERMPLWVLDLIICLLVTLFIAVVLIGVLQGNAR